MPRLRQVPRADATDEAVTKAYDRLFGPDRDPVAEPGTATGTPGNWWTVFALSPEVLRHAVAGFSLYQGVRRTIEPSPARAWPDARRMAGGKQVRVLPALQVLSEPRNAGGENCCYRWLGCV